jgi:hypothetical protein
MATIPYFPYKLFFLYIEPLSALGGAYYAHFMPKQYLHDLSLSSSRPAAHLVNMPITTQTSMALTQLANLYLLFALNEHLVLSSTNDLRTWKTLLFGLLVADFGHLYSMMPVSAAAGDYGVFWKVWEWNAMCWGSVAFVYMGALMRTMFLLGVGLGGSGGKGKKKSA